MRMFTKTLTALLTLSLFSATLSADIELKFGIYATDRASTLVKKFKPVLNALEERMTAILGEPVTTKIVVAKTYEGGFTNLRDGVVDF